MHFFSDDLSSEPCSERQKTQARTSINIAKSLGSRFIFAPWQGLGIATSTSCLGDVGELFENELETYCSSAW